MTRRWRRATTLAALAAMTTAVVAMAPDTGSSIVLAQSAAPDGARLYSVYCASCHGTTGQGNGPVAAVLRRAPSDLTVIAAGNGGVFPSARVHRIIDGRDVEAHGVPEMPVWGDAFRRTSDGSDEAVHARIAALVKHLEGFQRRNAQ